MKHENDAHVLISRFIVRELREQSILLKTRLCVLI